MNRNYFLMILLLFQAALLAAQKRTDQPWQLDIAAGMHSFYAPLPKASFSRPELITMAGFGKPLGPKQQFGVTLQVGYARNNYQGDAVFLQLLGQYTPVIANHLEVGVGLGFGYRLSFYPSQALSHSDGNWRNGRTFKGQYQVPLQFSLGYRGLHLNGYDLRPYMAVQLQPLLGYNPDLSPLPITASMLGIKIQKP